MSINSFDRSDLLISTTFIARWVFEQGRSFQTILIFIHFSLTECKNTNNKIFVNKKRFQTEKKSESQPSVLSSTVLHGHSKKNTPAVPDGISPIQATKLKKVEIQAPLKLFDKMASLSESRDDENNTSHDGDKGKKPKKKKKKKTKVPGFMN